jgi:hypothetical protein
MPTEPTHLNEPAPDEEPPTGNAAARKGRAWRKSGVILLAGLGAAGTAFVSGIGSKVADRVTGSDQSPPSKRAPSRPPVSYSAIEVSGGCDSMFLPLQEAKVVLQAAAPTDWSIVERKPGALFANTDSVQVSVQGESARTITLTGITFAVTRLQRPSGTAFYANCGGPATGRSVEANLDKTPPQIVESSADRNGIAGLKSSNGHLLTRPITFPWTVSLTDPLLLYVNVKTNDCYCVWRATIPWVSGGQFGTIHVDNHGKGYRVVYSRGLQGYQPGFLAGKWNRIQPVRG